MNRSARTATRCPSRIVNASLPFQVSPARARPTSWRSPETCSGAGSTEGEEKSGQEQHRAADGEAGPQQPGEEERACEIRGELREIAAGRVGEEVKNVGAGLGDGEAAVRPPDGR